MKKDRKNRQKTTPYRPKRKVIRPKFEMPKPVSSEASEAEQHNSLNRVIDLNGALYGAAFLMAQQTTISDEFLTSRAIAAVIRAKERARSMSPSRERAVWEFSTVFHNAVWLLEVFARPGVSGLPDATEVQRRADASAEQLFSISRATRNRHHLIIYLDVFAALHLEEVVQEAARPFSDDLPKIYRAVIRILTELYGIAWAVDHPDEFEKLCRVWGDASGGRRTRRQTAHAFPSKWEALERFVFLAERCSPSSETLKREYMRFKEESHQPTAYWRGDPERIGCWNDIAGILQVLGVNTSAEALDGLWHGLTAPEAVAENS